MIFVPELKISFIIKNRKQKFTNVLIFSAYKMYIRLKDAEAQWVAIQNPKARKFANIYKVNIDLYFNSEIISAE